MKLSELIKNIDKYDIVANSGDFQVKGLSCDSREVMRDFVFVAIKGTHEDGHKFIDSAIERGARAIVLDSLVKNKPDSVSIIQVKDARRALAQLSSSFWGDPSSKINVVGVTGTNGKTTITYLIEAILKEAKINPAVIGTVNYRIKNKIIPSRNTTPGPVELQPMLSSMIKEGAAYAVMEVSSHALDQGRVEGIKFHSAIFTNLTQDHLDYHLSLENYFLAKTKLFRGLNPESFAIINSDDAYAVKLKKLTKAKIVTYGIVNRADVMAEEIKFDIGHTEFMLKTAASKKLIRSRLIGRHNVYNILASIAWALKEGLGLSMIESAIAKFNTVPGRLERVESKGKFSIFVDYAHTEDALKNVINTLRPISSGKIIVVFGCGGERDISKRPKMGHIVTELADYAVITNDNPRSEDPDKIINDIRKGISKNNYCVIPDRKEAIIKSLTLANDNDIILIAGKGHETYQILKDKTISFDDREVVRQCLKSLN